MGLLKLVAAMSLFAAACGFSPSLADRYRCGDGGACPPSLVCASDGVCRAEDEPELVVDLSSRYDARCAPAACAPESCGAMPDGCGGTVTCIAPCNGNGKLCGGGGPNRCGKNACLPSGCGSRCGVVSDGCAGVLDCGVCH